MDNSTEEEFISVQQLSRIERRRRKRLAKLRAREYDRQRNRALSYLRKAGSHLRDIILTELAAFNGMMR